MPAPELAWAFYRKALLDHYQQDPEGWKHPWRWSTVVATMYVGPGIILSGEVESMRTNDVPIPDWQDEDASNLLHQRYHLWQWERAHPTYSVADLRSIVEFGSGYGAMALVAYRLGFRGKYWLVDFPEFAELAVRNLHHRAAGLDVAIGHAERPDLLISIFGLSEAPIEDRDAFLSKVNPRTYLLGMQGEWGDIRNPPYFLKWASDYFGRGGPLFQLSPHPFRTKDEIFVGPFVTDYLVSSWNGR